MRMWEKIQPLVLPVALAAVGLSLAISGLWQSLQGRPDFGVPLWPPILVIAGGVACGAALSRRTGFMLFATGLVGTLGLYGRTAGDGTLLLVALGLLGLVVVSAGIGAGARLASAVIGFASALGLAGAGLFLVYGGLLAGDQASQWLGGAVLAFALAAIGFRLAWRHLRAASKAALPIDSAGTTVS